MAKFRCTKCNKAIELNKSRGFKSKDHNCECGGFIQEMYHCEMNGTSPERIKTSVSNNHFNHITCRNYYNAWRNRRHGVFIINTEGRFEELTFEEHNNFDFVK